MVHGVPRHARQRRPLPRRRLLPPQHRPASLAAAARTPGRDPSLAHHYLQKYADEYRKGDLRLSEETMEYLVLFRWPGNVRQLANEMRRLAVLAETGAVLMPEHLSPEIAASRRTILDDATDQQLVIHTELNLPDDAREGRFVDAVRLDASGRIIGLDSDAVERVQLDEPPS